MGEISCLLTRLSIIRIVLDSSPCLDPNTQTGFSCNSPRQSKAVAIANLLTLLIQRRFIAGIPETSGNTGSSLESISFAQLIQSCLLVLSVDQADHEVRRNFSFIRNRLEPVSKAQYERQINTVVIVEKIRIGKMLPRNLHQESRTIGKQSLQANSSAHSGSTLTRLVVPSQLVLKPINSTRMVAPLACEMGGLLKVGDGSGKTSIQIVMLLPLSHVLNTGIKISQIPRNGLPGRAYWCDSRHARYNDSVHLSSRHLLATLRLDSQLGISILIFSALRYCR